MRQLTVGMKSFRLARILVPAYRVRPLRPLIRAALQFLEGGMMFSATWRQIMSKYEGVSIGDFSYGVEPGVFPAQSTIGTFCSIAPGIRVLRRNHPPQRVSLHPLFFNHRLQLVERDTIPEVSANPLTIGGDVWIGANVIICPGCQVIGDGSVIAAGAVVTRDVPSFTVVGGNPARQIRRRFHPKIEAHIAASQWWLQPLPSIVQSLSLFTRDADVEMMQELTRVFPPVRSTVAARDSGKAVANGS